MTKEKIGNKIQVPFCVLENVINQSFCGAARRSGSSILITRKRTKVEKKCKTNHIYLKIHKSSRFCCFSSPSLKFDPIELKNQSIFRCNISYGVKNMNCLPAFSRASVINRSMLMERFTWS